jgi:hypothetical protein
MSFVSCLNAKGTKSAVKSDRNGFLPNVSSYRIQPSAQISVLPVGKVSLWLDISGGR